MYQNIPGMDSGAESESSIFEIQFLGFTEFYNL